MFCKKCILLRNSFNGVRSKSIQIRQISTSNGQNIIKGFEDIPSPRGLPFIGTALSVIRAGSTPKLHCYIDKRHKQFGSIFKESIGPVPCVFISDPEAMRSVFAHEGKYPIHLLPEAWTTYNTLNNVSRGLFFMHGEEWLHFRRIMNPLLLKGEQPWMEDSCKPAIDSLLSKLLSFSNRDMIYPNMEELLYEWSLEVIVSVLIGPENYSAVKQRLEQRIKYLASVINLVFDTSSKLSLIPSSFAAKFRISRWRQFEHAVTNALKSSAEFVELLSSEYLKNDEGLLGKLKLQMSSFDLARIITDLLLAAGDTTAYSMEWLLYLVGKNEDVQNKLREELRSCSKEGKLFTSNIYLRNVVKESLRLYPVAPFLTRILPQPAVIKNYNMPTGTVLILSIFSTGRDERFFPNPLQFDPHRWNRNNKQGGIVQSASLPFAIGSRTCIGKKLAETQLQKTLAEIVSNFSIKVDNSDDVDVILKMVAVPSEQIKFNFKRL